MSSTWVYRIKAGNIVYFTDRLGNYVGDYKKGKKHGPGTITYPEGVKYTGNWEDGDRIGEFAYSFPNGEIIKGRYFEHPTLRYTDTFSELIEDGE